MEVQLAVGRMSNDDAENIYHNHFLFGNFLFSSPIAIRGGCSSAAPFLQVSFLDFLPPF